jgi:hypothetical protein
MSRKRKLSANERTRQAVQRGDLDALLELLAAPPVDLMLDQTDRARAIHDAVRINAQRGLKELIESVLTVALEFDSRLLALQQLTVRQALVEGAKRYGPIEAARCVPQDELDRLGRVEEHVTRLARQAATIRHTFSLAESAGDERRWQDRIRKRQTSQLRLVAEQEIAAHA